MILCCRSQTRMPSAVERHRSIPRRMRFFGSRRSIGQVQGTVTEHLDFASGFDHPRKSARSPVPAPDVRHNRSAAYSGSQYLRTDGFFPLARRLYSPQPWTGSTKDRRVPSCSIVGTSTRVWPSFAHERIVRASVPACGSNNGHGLRRGLECAQVRVPGLGRPDVAGSSGASAGLPSGPSSGCSTRCGSGRSRGDGSTPLIRPAWHGTHLHRNFALAFTRVNACSVNRTMPSATAWSSISW